MKKKIFLVALIFVVAIFVLTACDLTGSKNDEEDVYTKLNKMTEETYDKIDLGISTTYKNYTLNSKFFASVAQNGTMVTYSVERLATIEQDENGQYVMPEEQIATSKGSATIKNGKIVEIAGDKVDIPVESLDKISLKFSEEFFSSALDGIENGKNVFKATVTNPVSFTGNIDFDGKDMTVDIVYGEKKFEKVSINYTSKNGALVKVVYSF